MARYTGPSCRLCRREGTKLFLKGTRCSTEKCAFGRRSFAPGMHGKMRSKISDYGLQLREKQKVKRIYGILERQFRRYFQVAVRRKGITGEYLLQQLERRLDNVVLRAGFALSLPQARQIVRYGHITVNGRRNNIPSYQVKVNDVVEIKAKESVLKQVKECLELTKDRAVPGWLTVDRTHIKAAMSRLPVRDDVPYSIQEQLIVELYSK